MLGRLRQLGRVVGQLLGGLWKVVGRVVGRVLVARTACTREKEIEREGERAREK